MKRNSLEFKTSKNINENLNKYKNLQKLIKKSCRNLSNLRYCVKTKFNQVFQPFENSLHKLFSLHRIFATNSKFSPKYIVSIYSLINHIP